MVTILSTAEGVAPTSSVMRYCKDVKKRVEVACPKVIKEYNGRMGGVDKSDMLTHLYRTPMRARRWYVKIFGYAIDLCICNAWLLYKRDCASLGERHMKLKKFRLHISKDLTCQNPTPSRPTRQSMEVPVLAPKKGQKQELPSMEARMFSSTHMPVSVPNRQTCKHCSKSGSVHRSRWICSECNIALCLSESRNCFLPFHRGEDPPSK